MDLYRVPFNTGFIFGKKKKSKTGLGQVSRVNAQTRESCALPEMSCRTVCCVLARCHGEESISHSSPFQIFFFLPVHDGLSKPPYRRRG
jgi:hypothetical protein